jgi:hypothetical protein
LCMQRCEWIERVPLKVLLVIPAICAGLNGAFLLLARSQHRMQISDVVLGSVSGVLLGIALLCLIVGMMRKRLAA